MSIKTEHPIATPPANNPSGSGAAHGGAGDPDASQNQPQDTGATPSGAKTPSALSGRALLKALPLALRKLNPVAMIRRPVLFVVELGAALLTVLALAEPFLGAQETATPTPAGFTWAIAIWLWLTVLFGSLAEAVAEGRGKAQADTLRKTRSETPARVVEQGKPTTQAKPTAQGGSTASGSDAGNRAGAWDPASDPAALRATVTKRASSALVAGDVVVVEAGELIPGDGDVIHGVASVDESAITGESAPVVRESGGDRSSVTGGTRVLSDRLLVRITSTPGQTFVDRMIALVEGASRRKTPNEVALDVLLATLTLVFLVVTLTLNPIASAVAPPVSLAVLVALLVCLIPTTISALLSAIGIAGMDRLVRRNVLALSGRAVEAAGDVSTLLLDKTGTITYGNRRAVAVIPAAGVDQESAWSAAVEASAADTTPEGRSVLDLARTEAGAPSALADAAASGTEASGAGASDGTPVAFSATTRMSGVDRADGSSLRKGAASAVLAWLDAAGQSPDARTHSALDDAVGTIAASGGTPLVVAELTAAGGGRVLAVIHLKDVVKEGLPEKFAQLRAMGIRTVMITGDNQVTARAIAAEAGVDDVLAEATPEDKLALIKAEQSGGRMVAMTGDGTNDAPALAQADVGVAMNTGTSAAKEAGNMVDLDSDPAKLIDIVAIGKQLLITRGALTTFSIANDLAKYFAIVPAMFMGVFPQLAALNVMSLSSPASAVLSAVIFNAVVILALIPLSLRGVKYRAVSASKLLGRNLLIYGLGGVVAPFVGIKLIDLLVSLIPGF
ncbi:potassium-transporting ATPase subunit KdpB [Galactobacter caseinivorans]|uniref:Potassium-transporting ATPase ATP-binding subunit n=1 Tax=Galactobacter caseinivorans TaxID=2676123 RepID=A0A496PG44_9MICC|nr:potassium-transporting ATPase subunit KdpB [Galactobacter caseinivorans]RKW69390.1 K(+)-transporting ATPase subunit B [Galactobacter caseinivorans]